MILGGEDATCGIMDEDGDMLDGIVGESAGTLSSNSKVKYIVHCKVVNIVNIYQILNPDG